MSQLEAIEIVDDRTADARCDEGFLHVRRLVCVNRRTDGSASAAYPVDVVDRPSLDAVAVVIFRREGDEIEILLRDCLRPAAYLRKDRDPTVTDPRVYLAVPEIVAGVLEPTDRGAAGVRARAAAEVLEEAGYEVSPDEVIHLGAPFFVAPGILSEKIHLTAVDVGDRPAAPPEGDGSPLEEGGRLEWVGLRALIGRCAGGEVEDAKTEIGAHRLRALLEGD